MAVVRINAITVPAERAEEFEARFAARAGEVSSSPGFEAFELLRPSDDRGVYLVYTRWEYAGGLRRLGLELRVHPRPQGPQHPGARLEPERALVVRGHPERGRPRGLSLPGRPCPN